MKYQNLLDRFITYVKVNTRSDENSTTTPSTQSQVDFATNVLIPEMKRVGLQNVYYLPNGYAIGTLPANDPSFTRKIGFISHMDTADFNAENVNPQIVENYDGGVIALGDSGFTLDPADFAHLNNYKGQTLITTDGTTLLGADDKAGIAEIMTMAAYFLRHPEVKHGTICIGFTPDEEVGRGADGFDVDGFGADVAYTVDGGALGELEYENFNAASGRVTVHGANIHPGTAKGRMRNALLMAMEFQSLLPADENPMYTEGYEGFYHLDRMTGCVEETRMDYIIRDHDRAKFERRKELFSQAAGFLNQKYGSGTVEAAVKDSYYNMKEKIEPHMDLIDKAKASMEKLGIWPIVVPIRGGTDGARLSYMGLPCPNLCTGGHNFHGKYEFIPVQSMEKITELLIEIARSFAEA